MYSLILPLACLTKSFVFDEISILALALRCIFLARLLLPT